MNLLSQRYSTPILVIILVLGAIWIAITAIYFDKPIDGEISAPKEGFTAPNFNLETITGDSYQLSDLHGKVILLNFWASWCPPCRTEMPAMERVYQSYKNQDFMILAVNAAHQDTFEKAVEFASTNGLTFPILLDYDDSEIEQYQVHSFPTSLFIDKNGIVQEVVIGGPMSQALLETRVQTLIAKEP